MLNRIIDRIIVKYWHFWRAWIGVPLDNFYIKIITKLSNKNLKIISSFLYFYLTYGIGLFLYFGLPLLLLIMLLSQLLFLIIKTKLVIIICVIVFLIFIGDISYEKVKMFLNSDNFK